MMENLKRVFVAWIVIYPTMTLLITILEPVVSDWALPFKTLLLTAIMVPVVSLYLMPLAQRQLGRLFGVSAN